MIVSRHTITSAELGEARGVNDLLELIQLGPHHLRSTALFWHWQRMPHAKGIGDSKWLSPRRKCRLLESLQARNMNMSQQNNPFSSGDRHDDSC